MKRVTRIDAAATERLLAEALPLLPPAAKEIAASARVFVTRTRRGRADWHSRTVTVPGFVFKAQVNFAGKGLIAGGPAFAAYYLAHELAHIKACTDTHGAAFMAAFQDLCPAALRWYETRYKPRRAAAAGIADHHPEEHPA